MDPYRLLEMDTEYINATMYWAAALGIARAAAEVATMDSDTAFQIILEAPPFDSKTIMLPELCGECDSEITPDGYCMMGHWCGPDSEYY